ncbi:MAG TPA: beta-propeller fold lactonase family protein [Terriglobales bacterium]|nr:beta-propeller fold lactonase family protein [Terriglobales bacterium]
MKTRLLVCWCALLVAGIVVTGCGFFNNTPGSTTPGTTGFVYVLNSGGTSGVGSVSGYAANPATGVLSSLVFSPFVVASQVSTPNSMSGDAFGRYLYVSSNVGGGGINGFLISQNTNTAGQLSSVGVTATKAAVVALVVDPAGGAVYAVEAGPQVEGFSIASGTGVLTAQANSPYSLGSGTPTSIAIAPSGGFLFVGMNNGFIVTVPINSDGILNTTNIVRTAPLAGIINVAALTVDPTVRFLYAVDGAQYISLFAINATTGALTAIQATPVSAGAGPVSVGVAAVTGVPTFLYTANDGGTLGAFIISSSGTLSLVSGSPFSSSVTPLALAVDPSGAFLYVVGSGGSNTVLSFVIVGGVLQAPSTTNPPTGTSPTSVVAVP